MKNAKKGKLWEKILYFSAKLVLYSVLTASLILLFGTLDRRSKSKADADEEALSEARVAYYESRVSTLEEDLLEAKRQLYVSGTEYRQLLSDYESLIEKSLPADSGDQDLSVSGDETGPVPIQTDTAPGVTDTNLRESTGTSIPTTETVAKDNAPASSETGTGSTTPLTPWAGLQYLVSDGQITVTGYSGDGRELEIPDSIAGFPVTTIGDGAFDGSPLEKVVIPESVTRVGWFAFARSSNLTSVVLPLNLSEIGYEAFTGCPSLTVVCPQDSYARAYAVSYGLPCADPSALLTPDAF